MAYNSESIKEAKEKYLLEMNDDALERLFRLLHSEKVIVICRSNMTEAQAASAGLKELEPDILRDAGKNSSYVQLVFCPIRSVTSVGTPAVISGSRSILLNLKFLRRPGASSVCSLWIFPDVLN